MITKQKIFLFLLLFSFQLNAEVFDIYFKNLSLNDFIKVVGKIMKKNILLDEKIENTIINYPISTIDKDGLIPLTRFLLQKEGLMLIDEGYMYHITKIKSKFNQNKTNKDDLIFLKEKVIKPLVTDTNSSKKILNSYSQNIEKTWKDIGIEEYRVNGQLKGFKINFIKKGSDFEELGLKKGDIIQSVNGVELTSYKSAYTFYGTMDNISELTLGIKRDNQDMELEYDIK